MVILIISQAGRKGGQASGSGGSDSTGSSGSDGDNYKPSEHGGMTKDGKPDGRMN